MKKILLFVGTFMVASVTIISISCNKPTLDTNTTTATDNNLCENEFMRILPTFNSLIVSHYGKGVHKATSVKYPTISLLTDTTKTLWPRVFAINYGPAPGIVDSSDGKTRYGTIYFTENNYWSVNGTTATVSFNAYFVNSVNYNAGITITRNSATVFKLAVVNGVCTSPNWTITNFVANRTFTWTAGVNDTVPSHSQYSITGSGSGTDRNKVNYTFSITSALVKRNNCSSICQGQIQIVPAGLANRSVDFGNGTCTGQATVTINGQNFTVSE